MMGYVLLMNIRSRRLHGSGQQTVPELQGGKGTVQDRRAANAVDAAPAHRDVEAKVVCCFERRFPLVCLALADSSVLQTLAVVRLLKSKNKRKI